MPSKILTWGNRVASETSRHLVTGMQPPVACGQQQSMAATSSLVQMSRLNNMASKSISENTPTSQAPVNNPLITLPSDSKRKMARSAVTYPRKRAVMACETCRKRKVKCDNQRPSCGGCQTLQIECIFRDSKTEHSSFVPRPCFQVVTY